MGRHRKTNRDLPPRVYRKHGAFYFVTHENKWLRLGTTTVEMYAALAKLMGEALGEKGGMSLLFERYAEEISPQKSAATQADHVRELRNLDRTFGHLDPRVIKTIHVYQYLDARGKSAKVRANREIALLSSVFSYAIRWGIVEGNPCTGVRKHSEKPRQRYVTDEEYLAVYDLAPPIIQTAMEVALLTGMRQADILGLQRHQILPDGIHVTPAKTKSRTGRKQIFLWTPGLRDAIDRAVALPRTVSTFWVFANSRGQRYTASGFQTAWQRLMARAIESGALTERFTFHDLRAKAGSESSDGTRLLGHQNPATTRRIYLRKPDKVKPIR